MDIGWKAGCYAVILSVKETVVYGEKVQQSTLRGHYVNDTCMSPYSLR